MILDAVHYREVPARDERLALFAWLREHGIDPNDVAMPCTIQRETGGVRYPRLDRGATAAQRDLVIAEAFVPTEGEPRPWPDEVTAGQARRELQQPAQLVSPAELERLRAWEAAGRRLLTARLDSAEMAVAIRALVRLGEA